MNKTILFVVFAVLAGLGLAGYVVVLLLAPQAAQEFVGTLVAVLAIVSASATTFYMLGKTQTTLEEVKTQTNGNLSTLRDQLVEKDRLLAEKDRQLLSVVGSAPPAQQ